MIKISPNFDDISNRITPTNEANGKLEPFYLKLMAYVESSADNYFSKCFYLFRLVFVAT